MLGRFALLSIFIGNCLLIVVVARRPPRSTCRLEPYPLRYRDCHEAKCIVSVNSGSPAQDVSGVIRFRECLNTNTTWISAKLKDFDTTDADTLHGFHVHEGGDLGDECKNAGGHFNPHGATHGAPEDSHRHVGDLGNIEEDLDGNVHALIGDSYSHIHPHFQDNNTISRAIVIHAGEDDVGRGGNDESLKTGNAGPRLACCRIQSVLRSEEKKYASCVFSQSGICGRVIISQLSEGGPSLIEMDFNGFPSRGMQGFHIHEHGNLGNGCTDAGGHYNPLGKDHSMRHNYNNRHVGDLGNLHSKGSRVQHSYLDPLVSLRDQYSVIGRSIVIHMNQDDGMGSSGNAGPRVACCKINGITYQDLVRQRSGSTTLTISLFSVIVLALMQCLISI